MSNHNHPLKPSEVAALAFCFVVIITVLVIFFSSTANLIN